MGANRIGRADFIDFIDDARIWCTLEGTIAGMLLRVCRGDLGANDEALAAVCT
jgi:hypothetical protein